jgi:ribosomal protein L7/L12
MSKVVLTGWKAGLKKVSLTTLLREQAALSLADAKHRVDALLTGDEVILEIAGLDKAEELLDAAKALGAKGMILKEAAAS